MRGHNVADGIRDAACQRQVYAGERVPQVLSTLRLHGLAVDLLVLEQFSDIGQDRAGDHGIDVDG